MFTCRRLCPCLPQTLSTSPNAVAAPRRGCPEAPTVPSDYHRHSVKDLPLQTLVCPCTPAPGKQNVYCYSKSKTLKLTLLKKKEKKVFTHHLTVSLAERLLKSISQGLGMHLTVTLVTVTLIILFNLTSGLLN